MTSVLHNTSSHRTSPRLHSAWEQPWAKINYGLSHILTATTRKNLKVQEGKLAIAARSKLAAASFHGLACSPLLLQGEGRLHVEGGHAKRQVAHGELVALYQPPVAPVLLQKALDFLQPGKQNTSTQASQNTQRKSTTRATRVELCYVQNTTERVTHASGSELFCFRGASLSLLGCVPAPLSACLPSMPTASKTVAQTLPSPPPQASYRAPLHAIKCV